MKLYIASHSQEAARNLMAHLELAGHKVVSSWVTLDTKFGRGLAAYTDAERTALAVTDETEVRAATDGLVLVAEEEGRFVPGGKHVETGIALALRRPVYVLGRRENLFHWHPSVVVVATVDALLDELRRRGSVPHASDSPHEGGNGATA